MDTLLAQARRAAELLKARGETIAVVESSAGGLVAAALLSVPGASAYFLAGAVVYTRAARRALLDFTDADMTGMRSASEPYARAIAERVRVRHGATWGLAETGASGPTGNSYGDAAGHSCIAVAGPRAGSFTLETGHGDRAANMRAFAGHALDRLIAALEG